MTYCSLWSYYWLLKAARVLSFTGKNIVRPQTPACVIFLVQHPAIQTQLTPLTAQRSTGRLHSSTERQLITLRLTVGDERKR